MDLDLSGKLALVTGSTRGIGLAAAKGLAGMGADVIVNGRERSAVFDAITQITRIAPKAKLYPAPFDLGGAAGCTDMIEQFSEVDILVNNLGTMSQSRSSRSRMPTGQKCSRSTS